MSIMEGEVSNCGSSSKGLASLSLNWSESTWEYAGVVCRLRRRWKRVLGRESEGAGLGRGWISACEKREEDLEEKLEL